MYLHILSSKNNHEIPRDPTPSFRNKALPVFFHPRGAPGTESTIHLHLNMPDYHLFGHSPDKNGLYFIYLFIFNKLYSQSGA